MESLESFCDLNLLFEFLISTGTASSGLNSLLWSWGEMTREESHIQLRGSSLKHLSLELALLPSSPFWRRSPPTPHMVHSEFHCVGPPFLQTRSGSQSSYFFFFFFS